MSPVQGRDGTHRAHAPWPTPPCGLRPAPPGSEKPHAWRAFRNPTPNKQSDALGARDPQGGFSRPAGPCSHSDIVSLLIVMNLQKWGFSQGHGPGKSRTQPGKALGVALLPLSGILTESWCRLPRASALHSGSRPEATTVHWLDHRPAAHSLGTAGESPGTAPQASPGPLSDASSVFGSSSQHLQHQVDPRVHLSH